MSKTSTSTDYEIVFQLNSSQATESGILFPPSCPVCYNHQTSADNKCIESCEGVVTSVALGRAPSKHKHITNSLIYIYDVESVDISGAKMTARFSQEHLAYASNCPVFLSTKEGSVEAVVAMSQTVSADKGETRVMYVIIARCAGIVKVEKGVKAARVRYRNVNDAKSQKRTQNAAESKAKQGLLISRESSTSSVLLSPLSDKTVAMELGALETSKCSLEKQRNPSLPWSLILTQ
jgi:hypothetical protein